MIFNPSDSVRFDKSRTYSFLVWEPGASEAVSISAWWNPALYGGTWHARRSDAQGNGAVGASPFDAAVCACVSAGIVVDEIATQGVIDRWTEALRSERDAAIKERDEMSRRYDVVADQCTSAEVQRDAALGTVKVLRETLDSIRADMDSAFTKRSEAVAALDAKTREMQAVAKERDEAFAVLKSTVDSRSKFIEQLNEMTKARTSAQVQAHNAILDRNDAQKRCEDLAEQLVSAQVSCANVTNERDAAHRRVDELDAELAKERGEHSSTMFHFHNAEKAREALRKERDKALDDLGAATTRCSGAIEAHATEVKAHQHTAAERDLAVQRCGELVTERDRALRDLSAACSERDACVALRDAALNARDSAIAERDAYLAEIDGARCAFAREEDHRGLDLATAIGALCAKLESSVAARAEANRQFAEFKRLRPNAAVILSLQSEVDALTKQSEILLRERETAVHERFAALDKLNAMTAARNVLIGALKHADVDRNAARTELGAMTDERDAWQGAVRLANETRDSVIKSRDEMTRERDSAVRSMVEAQRREREADGARVVAQREVTDMERERDAAKAELAVAVEELARQHLTEKELRAALEQRPVAPKLPVVEAHAIVCEEFAKMLEAIGRVSQAEIVRMSHAAHSVRHILFGMIALEVPARFRGIVDNLYQRETHGAAREIMMLDHDCPTRDPWQYIEHLANRQGVKIAFPVNAST